MIIKQRINQMSDADNNRRENKMRTVRTKVYQFSELSKEVQSKVIDKNYYINVDGEWWETVFEDAKEIGLQIDSFDIDRGSYCKGEFILSACEVAQNIFNNHGEICETYKTAKDFMREWQPIFNNYMDETHEDYESSDSEDKLQELEEQFLKSLCEDYRIMLTQESEYLTSEEAIKETIEANEYEFTKEGNRF